MLANTTRIYVPTLETNNMADGDVIEVRGYHKPGASSTKRQNFYFSLSKLQSDPGFIAPPIPTEGYLEFSIKRTAGTDRSYKWSVLNLNRT